MSKIEVKDAKGAVVETVELSDEIFAIYIPEYDGEVPGDNSIPQLANVALSTADGLFARVSGTVTSFGEAAEWRQE